MRKLKPVVSLLCLAGFISAPVFAAADSQKIEQLQEQVASLQQEVKTLKHHVKHKNTRHKKHRHALASSSDSDDSEPPMSGKELRKLIQEEREYLPFDLDVPGQAFVSTGPYVGVPIQYAGSDLVVNSPSVNTDLQLLGIRKTIHEQLIAMGGELFKEPYHSHLLLSGTLGVQANYIRYGNRTTTSGFDVSNVSTDALFLGPSPWTLGFIELSYDGTNPNNSPYGSSYAGGNAYTVNNSRVFVNKAFITIGDLEKSPFYGSVGQFYVPFGTYSSIMISDPPTKILTRTKGRPFLLGFQQQGDQSLYGSIYGFRGDAKVGSDNGINNGGINLGYKVKTDKFKVNVGGGVIADIADSGGMQLATNFSANEILAHRVPGYNLRGVFGLGDKIDFIAEFVSATTQFNPADMSYNGHGAKPYAYDLELGYSFMMFEKPNTIALDYAGSHEALAVGLPLTRYGVVWTASLWRNTLAALEFRHDNNYGSSTTANGPVVAGLTCSSVTCAGVGKSDNQVSASFDYYF